MMIKLALFLGTACISFNTFALTVGELNSALNKTNQQTAQIQPKMLYGGRDIISPKVINQTAESAQTKIS